MKILRSSKVPENSKFPNVCAEIRNYKVGKGREVMCAIVEEYAEKKAKEMLEYAEKKAKDREKQSALKFLAMGKLSVEEIAEGIPSLSVEEIKELQESMMQST